MERRGLYRVLPLHRLPLSLSFKILFVFALITVAGFALTLHPVLRLIYDNIWQETQDKLSTDLKIARMMFGNYLAEVEAVVDFTPNRFSLIEGIERGEFDLLTAQLERICRTSSWNEITPAPAAAERGRRREFNFSLPAGWPGEKKRRDLERFSPCFVVGSKN